MARPNSGNSDDIEFPLGIYAKKPHKNAPDFVWGKISIKIDDAIEFLQREQGDGEDWVNLNLQESKDGKLYLKIDRWKPDSNSSPRRDSSHGGPRGNDNDYDDDIPF